MYPSAVVSESASLDLCISLGRSYIAYGFERNRYGTECKRNVVGNSAATTTTAFAAAAAAAVSVVAACYVRERDK